MLMKMIMEEDERRFSGALPGDIAHTFICYLKRVTLMVGMPAEMEGKVVDIQTMVVML